MENTLNYILMGNSMHCSVPGITPFPGDAQIRLFMKKCNYSCLYATYLMRCHSPVLFPAVAGLHVQNEHKAEATKMQLFSSSG